MVILSGNMGKDPDIKYMDNGKPKASFTFATNETYTDKDGNRQTRTEWHNIVAWGKVAELIEKYVRKGDKLLIQGKIQYRSWDDRDGNKKYITEIIAEEIQLLSPPPGNKSAPEYAASVVNNQAANSDLPF